jgi:peptidoglycan/xylan/chitin deacetylase (PgdA/CDA1 family)
MIKKELAIPVQRILLLLAAVFLFLTFSCSKDDDPEPQEDGKILVLMYHRIVSGEPSDLYERSAKEFESDLKFLKENNVKILSFNELNNISAAGEMPAGNYAIITFDDGSSSWYTIVRPLLIKYNMKATFFLWAYMIGHDSFITWEEVKDMSHYTLAGGERPFMFGSHSYSHSYLLRNRADYATDTEYNSFLDYEMGVSKELIEQYVPGEIDIFSLPYGDGAGNAEIIAAAKRNGYKFIRTSVWAAIENVPADLFQIPALPILDSTPQSLIGEYIGLGK